MSSRALRRLQGDSGLSELTGNVNDGTDEVDNDDKVDVDPSHQDVENDAIARKSNKRRHKKQKNAPVNPFELLNADNDDDEVSEVNNEEDAKDIQEEDHSDTTLQTQVKSSGKGKKKKKKRKGKEAESNPSEDGFVEKPDDEIEASIQEVNRILGDPGSACAPAKSSDASFAINMKPLLHIDYRNLNPETELKRMFGSQVVRGDQQNRNRRQRNQRVQRNSRLVQPKETWHSTGGSGLSMKHLGDNCFAYVHSQAYQKLQFRFCDAVESGHPENIMEVLRENPYHVDSLIQMADFHRINEDFQTAAESIEKAVYGLECAFHPMFNMAAENCHLSYRRPENRGLHLCLFKHVLNLGRRGCNRTAFEFCKLLLSLDPGEDPLDCLSMIDFYALRSGQYDHLIQLEQEVIRQESGVQVPSFAMSVPLAYFKVACRDGGSTDTADQMLQDNLLYFPMILMPLLDQCNVQPDKRVSSHPFFNDKSEMNDDINELRRLITMYVKRCESCWKEPDVMAWLERNVTAVLDIIEKGTDPRPEKYAKLRYQRLKYPPISLLRHYVLCEIPGIGLPRQHIMDTVLNYDPFPPPDSIISYTRPQRVTVASQDQGGILRTLLHSLLPTYNPYEAAEDANRRRRANHVEREEEGEEGAGAGGIPQQIQQSVNAIMQAMRQLLNDPMVALNAGEGIIRHEEDEQPEVRENEREWEEEEEDFQQNQDDRR